MNCLEPVFRIMLSKERSNLGQRLHFLKMLVLQVEVGDPWLVLLTRVVALRLEWPYRVVQVPLALGSDLVVAVEFAGHEVGILGLALDEDFVFELVQWRQLAREEVLLGHVEQFSREILFEHRRDHISFLARTMHFQRKTQRIIRVLKRQRLQIPNQRFKPQIETKSPPVGHHRLIFPIPTINLEAPAALLESSFVALEGGGSVELMLDEVSVVRGVAEVVVDGEGLVVVDDGFFWVEDAVDFAENPRAEVFEGNGAG